MQETRCEHCLYYNGYRSGEGECHRSPPPWPHTCDSDWCGEFRRVEPTPPPTTPPHPLKEGD